MRSILDVNKTKGRIRLLEERTDQAELSLNALRTQGVMAFMTKVQMTFLLTYDVFHVKSYDSDN